MANSKEQVERLTEIIESAGLEVRHYSGRGIRKGDRMPECVYDDFSTPR